MIKKIVKKVAKKTAAKKSVSYILPFNKANAKLFADRIYSDKGGQVQFLKLCEGDLSNGKDGGRTLHCALGEAYFTFVDTKVAAFVKTMYKKYNETVVDNTVVDNVYFDPKGYRPKYASAARVSDHLGTVAAIDALVDKAILRSSSLQAKEDLAKALVDTMQTNDDSCGLHVVDAMQRSMNVAEMWMNRVAPLLK